MEIDWNLVVLVVGMITIVPFTMLMFKIGLKIMNLLIKISSFLMR
jgi:hypothetical protein